MSDLPKTYTKFSEDFPEICKAYENLGSVIHGSSTLDDKTRALIKLALAVGGKMEGAVHSHTRKCLSAGLTGDEIRQVALLAIPTIGFPSSIAALTWINDILSGS